ncbi:MAG: outer membrane beta-barrel protein [Chitinophagaceae bacterium]|nr:outer membrane beta-barrel protein [Chitinophagaceae bacterium]
MLKRAVIFLTILLLTSAAFAQEKQASGILSGNVMDEKKKALEGASAEMISLADTTKIVSTLTDKEGGFFFQHIAYGHYRLKISYVGLQPLILDSIYFRSERSDFNLADLTLRPKNSENLGEIIVYAEKPLIQSKDGNITFNASESALSAGSNASDLLASVPLVAKDGDGKISVRGKEPKILIDDKPVELNMQQLQELLESMPGSSIEKIEVMTNPPPQYANEQGGVINIVTRKGKVGKTGRLNISGGTRGETAISGNYTYRKQGFILAINGGVGYSRFQGNGYSYRNNIYTDSSNFFNTRSNSASKGVRPNFRVNVDYDFNKYHSVNAVLQLNSADTRSSSMTEYKNINRFGDIYRLSERTIHNEGESYSGSFSLSYLLKTKTPGEQLRVILSSSLSKSNSDRDFFQQFFFPDHTPNGIDSTQQQLNDNSGSGYTARADYTRPLKNKTTFLNLGSYYTRNNSDVYADASYFRKSDSTFPGLDQLSNDFRFHQTVVNFRGSVRQIIATNFSATAGIAAEQTGIWFELFKENREAKNNYWTWLPFANINKSWPEKLNLTLSWRRSIRRPGINELNPTIDFGDPYNIRFGNEKLEASTADNFDFVAGRTKTKYYINIGLGYNIVKDIFSRVRTLLDDGKTQITWENISGRKEYEVSTWGGLTIAKKLRTNVSASYTYNEYSVFDRTYNRFRNGGSFTSNVSTTYTPKDVWVFTGSFNFNRFANPQGYARWNWSMNTGIQRRLFNKKLTATVNFIDLFAPQRNRSFTYGPNFNLESYNSTNTRNIRFTLGYNFTKMPKKKPVSLPVKK